MKQENILNKELKDKLDSFLYQYKESKEENWKEAVEVLQYARDILTNIRCGDEIDFELQQEIGNVNLKRIDELKEELKLSQFFDVLDLFLDGCLQYQNIQLIPKNQLKLYLKTILN